MYVVFVRINSGANNKVASHSFSDGWKAPIRCNPASLIFSTVWGFDAASTTGALRKRKELPSLYAAYASFLTH
jgi:hypothetical protein